MADAGGPVVAPTQGEALLLVSSDDDELVEYQQSREAVVPAGHEDIWEAATSDSDDFMEDLLTGTGAEQLHLSREQMHYLEPLSVEDIGAAAAIPLLSKETMTLLTKDLNLATETMRTPCTCARRCYGMFFLRHRAQHDDICKCASHVHVMYSSFESYDSLGCGRVHSSKTYSQQPRTKIGITSSRI